MKRTLRIALTTVLVFTMLFCTTFPTYAVSSTTGIISETAHPAATYSSSYPYRSHSDSLIINGSTWKTLATSTTGFNCNVIISCSNLSFLSNGKLAKGLVRMIGRNGNVLWTSPAEEGVPGQGSRVYWCGSDVYRIEIKTQTGGGCAWANPQ